MTAETDYGPAWEEFVSAISAAWPGETMVWSETPLELLTRLIDERDEAAQIVALVRELDEELDGVRIPKSAAAVMNAIRAKL